MSAYIWEIRDIGCRVGFLGAPLPCDRLAGWRRRARQRVTLERRQGERREEWDCGGIRATQNMMMHPWYGLLTLDCYHGGTAAEVVRLLTRSKA